MLNTPIMRRNGVPVRAKCRVIKGTIVVTKVLDWLVYATVMLGLLPSRRHRFTRRDTREGSHPSNEFMRSRAYPKITSLNFHITQIF